MKKNVKMDMKTDEQYDIKNVAKIDLRNITVEVAKNIKGIKNVALMIIPSDNEELAGAIMAIPKKNVATILRLPEKANIYEYTGKVFFTPDNLPKEDGIIFAQGTVYFTNPNNVQMPTINLVAIGQLFVGENVNIDLTYMTGTQKNGDFLYVQELKCDSLNAEFIENLKPKTLLHLGQNRKVKIENDIIVEMLKRKEVFVYYDENITKLKGNKSVITYINSTAL